MSKQKNRVWEDAKKPFTFVITPGHVENAKCGRPDECVVAQALLDSPLGPLLEGAEVGMVATKVYTGERVLRFNTPNKLRRAIPVFDITGYWQLPPGEYTLLPYKKRPRRWEKAKRRGGVQDIFRGRAMPSRRVLKINQLCAI